MLFHCDPDECIPVSESHTCSFHLEHPGVLFAGCTCWSSIGSRKATPEEYRERRVKRLADRRKALKHELAAIDAELEPEVGLFVLRQLDETWATGPEDGVGDLARYARERTDQVQAMHADQPDPLDKAAVLLKGASGVWSEFSSFHEFLGEERARQICDLLVDAAVQRMRAELFADETPPE